MLYFVLHNEINFVQRHIHFIKKINEVLFTVIQKLFVYLPSKLQKKANTHIKK